MFNIVEKIIDTIFPPRDTEKRVRLLHDLGETLKSNEMTFHDITYVCDYTDKDVRSVVVENKYHQNKKAAQLAAKAILYWLERQDRDKKYILVPVPLGKKRQQDRGYNQVTEILKALPNMNNVTIEESILLRTKETAPQTKLEKQERLTNMIDAFSCPHPEQLHNYAGFTIIIVDDVVTTGATLQVARAALEPIVPENTKVTCLALAH